MSDSDRETLNVSNIPLKFFKIVGFWGKNEQKPWSIFVQTVHLLLLGVNFILYGALPSILYAFRSSDELIAKLEVVTPAVAYVGISFKFADFIYDRRTFWTNLDRLHKILNRASKKSPSSRERLFAAMRESRRRIRQYLAVLGTVSFNFCGLPLLVAGLQHALGAPTALQMPTRGIFFYDYDNKFIFSITYMLCTFSSISFVILLVAFEGLYISMSLQTIAMFKNVQSELLSVGYERDEMVQLEPEERPPAQVSESEALQQLRSSIISHNDALEFGEIVKDMYKRQLFYQFAYDTLAIALGMFGTTLAKNEIGTLIRSLTMALGSTVQLFLYSTYGQRVFDESARVADAAYDVPWAAYAPRARRLAMLIMMRAQRPVCFEAAGLVPANYDTYSNIVRSAFSYCTLLRSVTE